MLCLVLRLDYVNVVYFKWFKGYQMYVKRICIIIQNKQIEIFVYNVSVK